MNKQCDNCKEFKVISMVNSRKTGAFVLFILGGMFLLFFWPVSLLLFIGGIVSVMASIGSTKTVCLNCKAEGTTK